MLVFYGVLVCCCGSVSDLVCFGGILNVRMDFYTIMVQFILLFTKVTSQTGKREYQSTRL